LLSGALCAAEALATATDAAMVPGTAGASSVVLPAMVTETSRTCAAAAVSCAAAMAGPSVYMEDSPTDWTGVPGIAQDNGKASGSERDVGGEKPFVDQMEASEAERYRGYWEQGHREVPGNTRPREQTAPGTRQITDKKLSENGELYDRQTIYDRYGRRIGNNDYTDHGRPKQHTNPHHHKNPPTQPDKHGKPMDGLHPETLKY
jgi:hypothetical protein